MSRRYLVMLYHRDATKLYQRSWIDACLDSIRHQTFQHFDVAELCYGDNPESLWGLDPARASFIHHPGLPTFVHATNYLLDIAATNGYDGAFNVHLDDIYALDRFERQAAALENFDLVSSNFHAIDSSGAVVHSYHFDRLDVADELSRDHNIVCNPVVAFSRRWLAEAMRFNPDACPMEDMLCWRANLGIMKMTVLPDFLCWKRMHPNEASMSAHR